MNQPFADLVVTGHKTIELRGWKTRHRGEFYVHASKKSMMDFVDDEILKRIYTDGQEVVTGAIVGKATLYGIRDYCSTVEENPDFINMDLLREDADKHLAMGYEEGKQRLYGFLIKDAVKFKKPIPYMGQLNFFNVTKTIQTKLEG